MHRHCRALCTARAKPDARLHPAFSLLTSRRETPFGRPRSAVASSHLVPLHPCTAGVRRGCSRVRALCRQVAPRGDRDGGSGHQADHPRRTTKARGTRERNGSTRSTARTAGAVDVRVSVTETERCCGTSQERSGRWCGGVRPEFGKTVFEQGKRRFVLRQRPDAGVSVRLQSDNIQRFRARMQETLTLYDAGAIEAGDVVCRVRAWLAHAQHGDTRALCKQELARLAWVRST